MMEESIIGAMSSWCTPTMLFLLLNFMIATIFVTSGFGSQTPSPHPNLQHQPDLLQRSPSMLQRLKSINFYHYNSRSHEPAAASLYVHEPPAEADGFVAEEDHELESHEEEDMYEVEDRLRSLDDVYGQLNHGPNVIRTKSDTEPASGAVPVKLVKKMKKSASSKSAFRHFSEAEVVEARRPATAREEKAKSAMAVGDDDDEVDSKADDFINKFKQQLKLQRLDSILRYKEMLGRGAAQ